MKIIYHFLICIFIITIVATGAYLRLNKLDAWGLWEDEYITEISSHLTLSEIQSKNTKVFHLINSLNGCICRYKNDRDNLSPKELRLPFTILGILSIIAAFFAGRAILNIYTGFSCSILIASSYYHIYYSREARYYAVFFLATIWAIHATWNCIKSKTEKLPIKEYSFYALASIFGLGIHQGFYFLFGILNLYLLILELSKNSFYLYRQKSKAAIKHLFIRLSIVASGLVLPVIVYANVIFKAGSKAKSAVSTTSSTTLLSFSWELIDSVQKTYWKNSLLQEYIWIILAVCCFILLFSKRFHLVIIWLAVTFGPLYYLSISNHNHSFQAKYIIFCYATSIIIISVGCIKFVKFFIQAFMFIVQKISINLHKWISDKKYISLLILLVLFMGVSTIFSYKQLNYNKKRYNRFFEDKRKSQMLIFDCLSKSYSSNDFIVAFEQPWRGPYVPRWIDYHTKNFPMINWKIVRASKLEKKIPEFNHDPFYVWWIIGQKANPIFESLLSKKFVMHYGNSPCLIRSQNKVNSCYEAYQMTKELYTIYYDCSRNVKRSQVYSIIANEIEQKIRKQTKNIELTKLINYINNSIAFTNNNQDIYDIIIVKNSNSNVSYKYVAEPNIKNVNYEYGLVLKPLDNRANGEVVIDVPSYANKFTATLALTKRPAGCVFSIIDSNSKVLFKQKILGKDNGINIDMNIRNLQNLIFRINAHGYKYNVDLLILNPTFD